MDWTHRALTRAHTLYAFVVSLRCLVLATVMGWPVGAIEPRVEHRVEHRAETLGELAGGPARPVVATPDTLWIADWSFDDGGQCTDAGWTTLDLLYNDGTNTHWRFDADFAGVGNISGKGAIVGEHNLCWETPDGYDNNWYDALGMRYVGPSLLSFDYLVDSEPDFDFLQVEIDSACASFGLASYEQNEPNDFRQVVWSAAGLDTMPQRVDSLALGDFGSADSHCVYIAFFADGAFSPADGLQPTTIGVGTVVDNVDLVGTLSFSEDFEGSLDPAITLVDLYQSPAFGDWVRLFSHVTDNDACTENNTCSWLWTDHTTPTTATDPAWEFGPDGYVVRNWIDNAVISPWLNLVPTLGDEKLILSLRYFGGGPFFWSQSGLRLHFSVREKIRIDNTDSPVPGDSVDCIDAWARDNPRRVQLDNYQWETHLREMQDLVEPGATEVQFRLRVQDQQRVFGLVPIQPAVQGPGPYVDRVRIGRAPDQVTIHSSAAHHARDTFPTEPGPNGPQPSSDRFGTADFFSERGTSTNPEVPEDALILRLLDTGGAGGIAVDFYGAIASGPHVGKAPPPHAVGANGFFQIAADEAINSQFSVDLDDDYFRGGDALQYFWYATDAVGGVLSDPPGLTAVPTSFDEAVAETGGLFEVNYLPTIDWDPAYLARIAADPNGKLEPTSQELANSSQRNCILYYQTSVQHRRAGDLHRTSFMYTLDRLGYRDHYDVYDIQSFKISNTPTVPQLAARASVAQATGYSVIITDASDVPAGLDVLPQFGVVDQHTWFRDWLAQASTGEAGHGTLWILGANLVEENPSGVLYATDMGVQFVAPDHGLGSNPQLEGIGMFTTWDGTNLDFSNEIATLNGFCRSDPPAVPGFDFDITTIEFDALDASGGAVATHRYAAASPGNAAVVMNSSAADAWNTIMMAFSWKSLIDWTQPPSAPTAAEQLAGEILQAILPQGCQLAPNPTGVGNDEIATPPRTVLHANYPNPFNPFTMIRFDLARGGHVALRVYDVAGRFVRELVNEEMAAGYGHLVGWDGSTQGGTTVSSGIYLYRLLTRDGEHVRKMIVVR